MPNITNRDCEKKVAKQVKIYDEKCPGLYVSVSPRGATFNLKFFCRIRSKQLSIKLGLYDSNNYTVDDARYDATQKRLDASRGIDIVQIEQKAVEQKKREGKTVNQIADEYVEHIKTPVKKPDGELRPRIETWKNIDGYLNRSVRPAIGNMIASDVENDHIAQMQFDIVAGKYGKPSLSNARNTRNAVSGMFNWAAEAGRKYVKASPCANLPDLDAEQGRERFLTADEIKALWWGLDRDDLPCSRAIALALKFELVTMLRTKEFLKSEPGEFSDFGTPNARQVVPLKRVKKRRPLIVPMSDLAQEIVSEARKLKGDQPYVFPGKFTGKPLDDKALGHAVRGRVDKKGKVTHQSIYKFLGMNQFTPHDLRRTAATLAGNIGFSDAEIAKCLDHRNDRGDDAAPSVTGIYVRSERQIEKQRLLDAVANAIREIVGPKPTHLRLVA